ncbi:MAG: hypothetical protein ABH849_00760 [Nanoarchaeota archaeon]
MNRLNLVRPDKDKDYEKVGNPFLVVLSTSFIPSGDEEQEYETMLDAYTTAIGNLFGSPYFTSEERLKTKFDLTRLELSQVVGFVNVGPSTITRIPEHHDENQRRIIIGAFNQIHTALGANVTDIDEIVSIETVQLYRESEKKE